MKFGLEVEKFIFDVKQGVPSESVFSLLDAMTDFDRGTPQAFGNNRPTNEFVLSMVEFGTIPSEDPLLTLKDYLFNYLMIKDVANREQVSLVPMASLPMDYLPHMTPKRAYYIQNSILSGRPQPDWRMDVNSPLKAAGNCAGIHVHAEIETPHEFLFDNNELKNKYNMGLMLSPMIAFSSSPYFFSKHEGKSMRGLRYYHEVYRDFPLNGGLPPVADSSVDVLDFVKKSRMNWIDRGEKLGFSKNEIESQIFNKSANWNPVRWNSRWNTIEIRCLDSDSVELDAAKFIWMCSALRRMDLKGENLQCRELSKLKLDRGLIDEAFLVSGGEVSILGSEALSDLFERAMIFGTKDSYVEHYLHRLSEFCQENISREENWLFQKLKNILNSHSTTSEILLGITKGTPEISDEMALHLVRTLIEGHEENVSSLKLQAPDIFQMVEGSPGRSPHV